MLFLFAACLKQHKQTIYFDYAATTPCDKKVTQKMQRYYVFPYGNANSNHQYGFKSKRAIEVATEKIADTIHAKPEEITFTSGATEANLIALKGLAYAQKKQRGRTHIITCITEHKSVLDVCKSLEEEGFEVTYLPVQSNGLIDIEVFKKAFQDNTGLVSIMWVNNETGVIQSIKEMAYFCKTKGAIFHTDAAQALGRLEINAHDVDCMSISAHKIYGPQGIGALYVKKGVDIQSLYGEENLRPGTLPTPLCLGFAKACELLKQSPHSLSRLSNELLEKLIKRGAVLNGDPINRVSSIMNIRFKVWPVNFLQNVAVSQGAACSKGPSHVLSAMGVSKGDIDQSFRISLGRFTKEAEIKQALIFLDDNKTSLE